MISKIALIFLILTASILPGCGPYGAGIATEIAPPCTPVAHVQAIYGGNFAYVDRGGRSVPATFGHPICFGDRFRTGPGTKLEVAFENGGTVTLDENTDPTFFQTVQCVFISIFTGRMVVNKNDVCVESGANKVHQYSYVIYEAVPNSSSLAVTVIRGQVDTISPPGYTIGAGRMIVLRSGQAVGLPTLVRGDVLSRMQSWIPVVTP